MSALAPDRTDPALIVSVVGAMTGAMPVPAMLKLLDQGGYQYGDTVEIQYQLGTDVALKIIGKPSKPL